MSQENVDLVCRAQEAWNREDLRALADLSDPDLEFVSVFSALDSGGVTYRGPELWDPYFARMHESWGEWQVEDFRALDAADDRVVSVSRLVGKGKSSGARVEHPAALTYRLRHGKLWRVRSYLEPAQALEAVGLSE